MSSSARQNMRIVFLALHVRRHIHRSDECEQLNCVKHFIALLELGVMFFVRWSVQHLWTQTHTQNFAPYECIIIDTVLILQEAVSVGVDGVDVRGEKNNWTQKKRPERAHIAHRRPHMSWPCWQVLISTCGLVWKVIRGKEHRRWLVDNLFCEPPRAARVPWNSGGQNSRDKSCVIVENTDTYTQRNTSKHMRVKHTRAFAHAQHDCRDGLLFQGCSVAQVVRKTNSAGKLPWKLRCSNSVTRNTCAAGDKPFHMSHVYVGASVRTCRTRALVWTRTRATSGLDLNIASLASGCVWWK